MECSPPGSSVHRISQARILESIAISFSRGSWQPRNWACISFVSCIGRWILHTWATREIQYIKYLIHVFFLRCIYLFIVGLGLWCCTQAFSTYSKKGCSSLWCSRFSLQWLLLLWSSGCRQRDSAVLPHRLSCSVACRIFLDQELNLYPLHWGYCTTREVPKYICF